jgi:general secretion pathway protein N
MDIIRTSTTSNQRPMTTAPHKPLTGMYRMAGGATVVLAAALLAATEWQGADAAGHAGGAANPLWSIPLDTLSVTRDHPIFSPTRRPPPAVVAAVDVPRVKPPPPPAEPDHPLLTLVGTIVGGPTAIGVFLDPATQSVIRLRTGQDFGGWVLHQVHARQTSFRKDLRTAVVALPPRDAPPTSGAVPSAPATDDAGLVADRRNRVAVSPPSRRSR